MLPRLKINKKLASVATKTAMENEQQICDGAKKTTNRLNERVQKNNRETRRFMRENGTEGTDFSNVKH